MQSIFEQIFRDDPQYGAFFRGEAIVETTIQLSFMVGGGLGAAPTMRIPTKADVISAQLELQG